MTEVRLVEVTKRFGEVVAVDHVSVTIKHGEFFTFLGPSGCGKTTTLRIIAGLEFPDEGSVFFDEEDVTMKRAYERKAAMVFQNYALWPHMSVFDNVAYGLKLKKLPPEEIKKKVEWALELVGLKGMEDRYPTQLSGGQQQRVALARAIVVEPRVLLLDEPLSNLDAKLRLKMREELKTLQMKLGITAIYVTHDQEEAMSLSDRIAVMNAGKIMQVGTPKEVYESPRNLFVATFIGKSTAVMGKADEIAGDRATITTPDGFKLRGRVAVGYKLSRGEEAVAIIRPEDFELEPPRVDHNVIEGVIEISMFLGPYNRLKVRTGKQVISAYVDPDISFKQGDRVKLYIPVDDVILFPAKGWEYIAYEAVA